MKKVALLTIFRVPNYGSVLQAFATVKVLNELGFECDVIDYIYPNEWHYKNGAHRYTKSIVKRIAIRILGLLGIKKGEVQKNKLNKFISSNFKTSKSFIGLNALNDENWTLYDSVIVGSDQVWNPNYLYGDKAFLLSFVPDDVNKTSIASSFAVDHIPDNLIQKYKRYLSKFSSITVRENNGLSILREQLDFPKHASIVLDPTLLLNRFQWLSAMSITESSQSDFILLYYLKYSFDSAPYIFEIVKYLSKVYNLKIKAICGEQSNLIKKHLNDYKDYSGCTVNEFVSLFANSKIVVTSSFHGTAFAVNFGKPLIAVIPENGDDRQLSLLNNLGISHCAVKKDSTMENLNPYYNLKNEQEKLEILRNQSLTIISENLNI